MPKDPIKVCITGAAGQIAYSLLYSVAKGDVFGSDQPLILTMLDIQPMLGALEGVCMELQDCAFPLLREATPTADEKVAFMDIDAALMVGAFPRKQGMERKDLLQRNAKIFESQGKSLDQYAKKSVKIVVVGNPANTNCCILKHFAPSIPAKNFSCLTRLDQNRACAQIGMRLKTSAQNVRNVTIWGNHSSTQYPDVRHASVTLDGVDYKPVREMVNDDNWLHGDFITTVQKRGAAVIAARKLSSAMSAANAICDHMRNWWFGTSEGRWVSMGVFSDGSLYGIPEGIIYSMPVTIGANREYTVVPDLSIDDFSREKMDLTAQELVEEKEAAFAFLGA
ncbi:malate dehydrogenase, cytoplasmic-like [Dendronephthya gigantea]|uniref:malate dehydrogenase, cytoplasmic-like n=1 Tax=Dendronephthya gigantea TaxID=151771 RepID=UPI00106D41D3|nr:malate dehydrogenase, cytoplasmic-like [Dendronephthya gigantea]